MPVKEVWYGWKADQEEQRQARRDRFICAAMQGFIAARQTIPVLRWQCVDEADHIIQFADAVLAEADEVKQ